METVITKNNRTGFVKGAAFIAILIILIILSSVLLKPKHADVYNITEVQRKVEVLKEEKPHTIDVLFSGDSESYRTFSPLQLYKEQGFTSYNLGASALRLCDAYEIFAEALETQTPKAVLLETDAILSPSDTHKDEEDYLTNRIEDIFPVFHYHIFYKAYLPESVKNQDIYWRDANILKGFIVQDMERPYEGGDYMAEDRRLTPIPENSLKVLERFFKLTQEKGISFIIVSAPSASTWHSGKHKAIDKWASSHGVPYIDLNLEPLQIDWLHDTMDGGNHVNLRGSIKATAFVGEYLREKYELEDHREEAAYADWDENVRKAGLY